MSVRVFFLFLISACVATKAENPDATHKAPAVTVDTLFRDYALAVCVADGYNALEVKADASAVASGYLENGSYPLEAYNEARELGRTFLAKDYPSIANAKLTLMKCIDFSQGKDITDLIRKHRKSK